jgi:hypothetical protein
MEGVVLDNTGGEYKVVNDLNIPKPGPGQILVKSLVTGINPACVARFPQNPDTDSEQRAIYAANWPDGAILAHCIGLRCIWYSC